MYNIKICPHCQTLNSDKNLLCTACGKSFLLLELRQIGADIRSIPVEWLEDSSIYVGLRYGMRDTFKSFKPINANLNPTSVRVAELIEVEKSPIRWIVVWGTKYYEEGPYYYIQFRVPDSRVLLPAELRSYDIHSTLGLGKIANLKWRAPRTTRSIDHSTGKLKRFNNSPGQNIADNLNSDRVLQTLIHNIKWVRMYANDFISIADMNVSEKYHLVRCWYISSELYFFDRDRWNFYERIASCLLTTKCDKAAIPKR